MAEPVTFRVVLDEPRAHRFQVVARFPAPRGRELRLELPVWAPGSYLVRDYARNLLRIEARDGRGPLPVRKVGKSAWRIDGCRGAVQVRYQLYGFERSVRTSHVTADHAFLSGPATFLLSPEHRSRPHRLKVEAPRGWKVACPLGHAGGAFAARDYDELVDSPIECGRWRDFGFTVADTPFRVLSCGRSSLDRRRLARAFPRLALAQRHLFGRFPFASYLAILNFTPSSRGGLEHRASMAIEWPRFRFADDDAWEDFLSLLSHELFHAWNVKDATPAAFRPYDYAREAPTHLLWWFEGVTDYYAELLLRRAHLLSVPRYLSRVLGRFERLLDTPGRRRTSLARASFDAWIKYYRPDENSPNATVSYYEKGHLVGALLDLEIRRRTAGRRSLDDVARLVAKRGRPGLPEDGVLRAVEEVAGSSFAAWFGRYIDGTAELPLGRAVATAGLRLEAAPAADRGGVLGVNLRWSAGRATIQTVLDGGPAERAGLSAGDELVAIDGARIDEALLRERLAAHRPGERVRLTLFRDDELGERTVGLGSPRRGHRLKPVARPGRLQKETFAAWLGGNLDELPEDGVAARS